MAGSIYMSAMLVGSYVYGYLSDKIGRRYTSCIALFNVASGLLFTAFAPNYVLFVLSRFITGAGKRLILVMSLQSSQIDMQLTILDILTILGSIGVVAVSFSLNIELVGEKYKTILGQLMFLGYTSGQVIIGLTALFIRHYDTFHIVLSVPCFLLLISYFMIPESPRWLIAKNRSLDAKHVIDKAAKFNKVSTYWV